MIRIDICSSNTCTKAISPRDIKSTFIRGANIEDTCINNASAIKYLGIHL